MENHPDGLTGEALREIRWRTVKVWPTNSEGEPLSNDTMATAADRQCLPENQYEVKECAPKCTCANGGTAAAGSDCPTNGVAKCMACSGSFYLSNDACVAWTTCTCAEYETVAPSNTQNRECATKQCTCANGGTAATGIDCPMNGVAK